MEEEYLPGGKVKRSLRVDEIENSLKIGDIDIKAVNEEAAKFAQELKVDEEANIEKVSEQFDEVLETQADILKAFSPEKEFEILYKRKLMKFILHEVDGSANLRALDINVHADLSDLEREVLQPTKTDLTPEEEKLRDEAMEKMESGMSENLMEYTYQVLSQFVFLPDGSLDNLPVKERREFWAKLPFNLKMFVSVEAMRRLGLEPGADVRLFQASGKP